MILPLALLPLLAACVAPSERTAPPAPDPVPAPTPTSQPAVPPASVEWQYRAATVGDWSYRTEAAGSIASFAAANAGPLLSVRCDRAGHRVAIARTGVSSGAMTIRTSYGAASWPATVTATQTTAVRAANDATLDQIAYSRGKFAVEIQGLTPLILPAWAEVARVIEDCRP